MSACPACGEEATDAARWCEACGAELAAAPAPACVACGERALMADGYCGSCGHKQPGPRDHIELEAGTVVAITDRGIRHHDNEDSVAIAALADGGAVIVVCDGVSSTPGSALASLAAAEAACALLAEELGADPSTRIDEALIAAVVVAQKEAAAVPSPPGSALASGGPPSSTLVAAVAREVGRQVQLDVAWVGDSRAYWVSEGEATTLTDDHELGGSLARWLGADSIDPTPELTHLITEGPGRLLVCTDGLWRYADPAAAMARLVGRLEHDHPTNLALAAALVGHAIDGGGHDNITVALWTTPRGPGLALRQTPIDQAPAPEAPADQNAAQQTDDQGGDPENE